MTRNKITKKILNFIFALMLPIISLCTFGVIQAIPAKADVTDYYTKFESITNSSFNGISTTYASNSFDGWSLVNKNTNATTMIIDVEKNYSQYENSPYCISTIANPGAKDADKKILMINSANTNNNPSSNTYSATSTKEGYKSNNISLQDNSYYILQASFKTVSFPSVSGKPFASIYLDGLKDEDENEMTLSYEMVSSTGWETVYFFIATGSEEQTVNLELWLGSKEYASFGVAFFDAIYLQRCSENIFYENYYTTYYNENNFYLNTNKTNTDANGYTYNYYGENTNYNNSSRPLNQLCEYEKETSIVSDINLDFEKDNSSSLSSLVDWKIAEHGISEQANAKVINITSQSNFIATTGYSNYTGSNYGYNNEKALVLWTNAGKTGYVSVVSKDIEIKAHECYKFTALVKVADLTSGSLTFEIKENNTILSDFPALEGRYTVKSVDSSVSSNGSNEFNNKYTQVDIYVQGHDLYNSSVNIIFSLGKEDSEAQGCVVVDEVKVTNVSYDEYSSANTSLKLNTITTDQASLSVPNGFFNSAYNETKNVSYPLTASNWTKSQETNAVLYSGVLNLYDTYFEAIKSEYSWISGLANPAKDKNDVNNVYVMHNPTSSYQSITSEEFSILSGSYYALSLDFKTIKTSISEDANLTVNIYDNDTLIYTDTTNSAGNWTTYKAYIYAGERATQLKATLSFGTSSSKAQGYVFIDNVKFDTTDKEAFTAAAKKSDLSHFMLNLDPTNSVSNTISTAYGWTKSGSNGEAGVIKGKDNDSYGYAGSDTIDDGSLENNVLILTTNSAGEIKLTSNIELSLDSDSYYKLTFRLLTSIPNFDKENIDYGTKVGLTNISEENAIFTSSNDGWKEYTMYFHNENDSSVSSKIFFSLTCSGVENTGYAYLTDLVWTEDDTDGTIKTEFENVNENTTGYNETVFAYTYANAESEESDEEETTPSETNDSQTTLAILLYVSSAITALAIIIAVIGYTLRKVKIKKVNKTTSADYDRKTALNQKAVTSEAEKIRKEEEKEIETAIEDVKAQIAELEAKQKTNINHSRENNGKITKEIEREFKSYAGKRTRLQDKLNMYNEKLTNVKSPEYMISLERKVSAQMMRERKEAYKASKKSNKD